MVQKLTVARPPKSSNSSVLGFRMPQEFYKDEWIPVILPHDQDAPGFFTALSPVDIDPCGTHIAEELRSKDPMMILAGPSKRGRHSNMVGGLDHVSHVWGKINNLIIPIDELIFFQYGGSTITSISIYYPIIHRLSIDYP